MNVAILFDTAGDEEAGMDMLLAGKELYSYSLKTFYLNPGIDYIVMMWRRRGVIVYANEYIECWKAEYGIDKPVKVYEGVQDLRQVFDGLRRDGMYHVESYVLHDVRYPFVADNMIYRATEKAALYGIAVTAGEIKDDLSACQEQKGLGMEGLRYARYPVAIRAGHRILDGLTEVAGVLRKCAEGQTYLCFSSDRNLFVGGLESVEVAEAILRVSSRGQSRSKIV